ncbi:MAG: DUF6088 family protein [Bacteroidota bacterium]|nr:DUF6088 family protein [Bacteroidota bacterium]
MKATDIITDTINRLPKGYIFTYGDFTPVVKSKEAIIKALNRLVEKDKIKKLSKGRYYKAEQSPFGDLHPPQQQVVKDLLQSGVKLIGYLTGYSIYNQLGLTTQVSNTIQIGRNEIRPSFKRGIYVIKFIRQKNVITENNIPLLQLLDCMRTIKNIPDTTIADSCKQIASLLKALDIEDLRSLTRLSKKYPPATRALLGSILDFIKVNPDRKILLNSLNPITTYDYPGISETLGKQIENWNIKS